MALSERISGDLGELMPKIAVQVAQRSSKIPFIDMGTAENWLIRDEVMEVCVRSVRDQISAEVWYPTMEEWFCVIDLLRRAYRIREVLPVIRI